MMLFLQRWSSTVRSRTVTVEGKAGTLHVLGAEKVFLFVVFGSHTLNVTDIKALGSVPL